MFNVYYLGNPVHGGYVTFNAHLLSNLKRNVVLKVSNKFEDKVRPLGWDKYYQNVSPDFIATSISSDRFLYYCKSNAWIAPVSGIWTFLAGIGAVVAPLIVKLYRDKRRTNDPNKKEEGHKVDN